ncbi:MAG: radical SAM protein [Saprospiraceae bacterium]|nr:radical SAM protein [Saprospiraceae bacterium]
MSDSRVLLITPPFTQINTPYPATMYLKGFLNTLEIESHQADLSLEMFLAIFSVNGLDTVFDEIERTDAELSSNAFRIYCNRDNYVATIDFVRSFLQKPTSTAAHRIVAPGFLPRANRFDQLGVLEEAFTELALIDKAKFIATLYLEDLSDFITEAVDPLYGFSRYAERIATALSDLQPLLDQMESPAFLFDHFLRDLVEHKLRKVRPHLVVITIPFPGNLVGALKCAATIKRYDAKIKIAFGGGYCNTELRSLYDERIFQFTDFIVLDDGERPLQLIVEFLQGKRSKDQLKRTFICDRSVVQFCDGALERDVPQREVGTPDYSDLRLDEYLGILEIANPMHRLWSDGRWNKLTMAHGCYWGKCTFCDVSLDYIARYEPVSAEVICDRIEEIIQQTGEGGFHFVDEAAPPALMKEVALEIIRRKILITWWTNIRFEKTFSEDLCRLLHASGCIAVSGGLEVASDRLLTLIQKGVNINQVTRVAHAFTKAVVMVHAYLMYGFPTQTEQETIDSLEVVRQLFANDVIQSGFWHQFSMTAHSPVGINPAAFQVERIGPDFAGFAENDLEHKDVLGAEHQIYSEGLRRSIFNYMNGMGLDTDLSFWFDFPVPETTIRSNYINKIIRTKEPLPGNLRKQCCWIGGAPSTVEEKKKGIKVSFTDNLSEWQLIVPAKIYSWLLDTIENLLILPGKEPLTLADLKVSFEDATEIEFTKFMRSDVWVELRKHGLLII